MSSNEARSLSLACSRLRGTCFTRTLTAHHAVDAERLVRAVAFLNRPVAPDARGDARMGDNKSRVSVRVPEGFDVSRAPARDACIHRRATKRARTRVCHGCRRAFPRWRRSSARDGARTTTRRTRTARDDIRIRARARASRAHRASRRRHASSVDGGVSEGVIFASLASIRPRRATLERRAHVVVDWRVVVSGH